MDKKQEDGTKRRRSKHCSAQGSTSRVFFEAKRSRREDTDTATYITTHARETPPRHEHEQEAGARQETKENIRTAPTKGRRQRDEHHLLRKSRSTNTRNTEERNKIESRQNDTQDKRSMGKPSLQTQLPADKKKQKKKKGQEARFETPASQPITLAVGVPLTLQ